MAVIIVAKKLVPTSVLYKIEIIINKI